MQQQSCHYLVLAKDTFDHVNMCIPGRGFERIWAVLDLQDLVAKHVYKHCATYS